MKDNEGSHQKTCSQQRDPQGQYVRKLEALIGKNPQ